MNSDDLHPQGRSPPKRRLGRSGVLVSPLGLGGAGLGNLYRAIEDDAAIATVRRALEEGMDFLDTAPYYGFGLSEKRIGEAVIGEHARVTLSTKVGRLLVPTNNVDPTKPRHGFYISEPFEPRFDYSYDGVLRSFESSLKRLRMKTIDVLLCHDIGALTHGEDHPQRLREFLEGGYRAMQELRSAGHVRAIGIGVNEWEVCAAVLPQCELDCVLLAGRYTLLEQDALNVLFPLCAERGVSIIVGGPFNSGILASTTSATHPHYNYEPPPPHILERAQRLQTVCASFSVPVAAAALQFPLAHPQVAAVIPGCSSTTEVARTKEWMRWPIPSELWHALKAAGLLHRDAPVPA
jgi:D-threo-aldose 1-dehydrogenase